MYTHIMITISIGSIPIFVSHGSHHHASLLFAGADVSAPQQERGEREDETWYQAPRDAKAHSHVAVSHKEGIPQMSYRLNSLKGILWGSGFSVGFRVQDLGLNALKARAIGIV